MDNQHFRRDFVAPLTYVSNMSSINAALEALDSAVALLAEADLGDLDPVERFTVLERLETSRRRQAGVGSDLLVRLEHVPGCLPVALMLADVLRISRAEARRRLRDAEQLGPRLTLSGEALPPELPATAKAWQAGLLDVEHLRVIQAFVADLPFDLDPAAAAKAESFLADKAAELRPDQLQKAADALAVRLNPDGRFSDEQRAQRRGFSWCGPQRRDGMSVGKLVATPQLRAELDAWFAKFAAPGMCNPDDQSPTIQGQPSQDVIDRDARGNAQRQHDALSALVRGQLGDPRLGQHNGLPVTLIATATLQQLQAGAGQAVTAGGTALPMRDLLRMATHAWHYLCVYDEHQSRPLYLGRSKRIATADQRVVLHALDRGCTAPGCMMPGYLTEVHHVEEWATGGPTNIDLLIFACAAHHKLLTSGGWKVRKRSDGSVEWIPPPHLPLRGGINPLHHLEKFLFEQD